MLKQLTSIIIATLILVFCTQYANIILHWLINIHQQCLSLLGQVFAGGQVGHFIKAAVALAIIPIMVGMIPGAVYGMVYRKELPYMYHIIWVAWIVLATAILLN